jgi:hypothetical protein
MAKRYAFYTLLLFALLPQVVRAQDAPQVSRTSKFLSHFDLGISGSAFFTKDVTGTVTRNAPGVPYTFTQSASSAAGAVVSLRGQKSAYKGLEFNYGYGRMTQSYTCCNQSPTTGQYVGPYQTQTTANEITFGYLARPPHKLLGMQPYVSGGAGVLAFSPTRSGGQSLSKQARAVYYYSAGLESMFSESFGVRAGFRQLFYVAPDFDQNYLRIVKRTFTSEPTVGVFVRF